MRQGELRFLAAAVIFGAERFPTSALDHKEKFTMFEWAAVVA